MCSMMGDAPLPTSNQAFVGIGAIRRAQHRQTQFPPTAAATEEAGYCDDTIRRVDRRQPSVCPVRLRAIVQRSICPAYKRCTRSALLLAALWCMAAMLFTTLTPTAAHGTTGAAARSPDEAGLPFIRNFSPAEYGGAPQNWSVIQDRNGVIYVGNVNDGLFAFDGARWHRIPMPNRSAVRSLAMDTHGRVYVGAVGEFGYLEPDAVGQMHYVSLMEMVPPEHRQFTDVWKTLVSSDGIYFSTRAAVFRIANGKVKVWTADTPFHMAFVVDDVFYIRQFERGLLRMADDKLEIVSGGERFADAMVYIMLPWKGADARPGELLIGTRGHGWWRFDGKNYQPWSEAADAATRDLDVYNGIWLSNGLLAVLAPPAGLLFLDKDGHVVRKLQRENGLANNTVNSLFEDDQHGLWVTSDIGVTRISIDRPVTTFDERNGLTGAVIAVTRYDGKFYAGTTDGLFELADSSSDDPHFRRLAQVKGATWSLLDSGHGLLVGATGGTYTINDGAIKPARSVGPHPVSMLKSRLDPNRIFLGSQTGLSSIRWDGRGWIEEGPIGDFGDEIRTMEQDEQGRLWLGTWNSHVLRITLPGSDADGHRAGEAKVARFNSQQGIPRGEVAVLRIDDELLVGSSEGIFSFDATHQRFVPDARFANMFKQGTRQMTLVRQDARGTLWMYVEDIDHGVRESGRAVRDKNGHWRWQPTPLQPLAGVNMLSILPELDGVVWFSGEQGLFRYAPPAIEPDQTRFSTLLRAISSKDGARLSRTTSPSAAAQIPYERNALRFEFSAPSFDTSNANRFQTQLTGLDQDWSPWSSEAYRDYTNIPDGEYRFQVRSHNVYGELGKTAAFDFHVLSPWYRTWWAWTLWSVLAAIGLTLVVVWRSTALRRRNRTLVALVEQRTVELQAAVTALSEQNITDPLTGLKNRRYLQDHITEDVAMAERQLRGASDDSSYTGRNTDMAFLMVDIDHFKQVNDTYGHPAGDLVLQQMRDILVSAARESDTPIRWGGEEFLIVARFTKPKSGALLAERLRAMVEAHPFDVGKGVFIHRTCSIGFASYPFFASDPTAVSWEQVVDMADACMYAAKQRGRNRWVGVQAGDSVMNDVQAALSESLEKAPAVGPLTILLSHSAS